MIAGVWGGSPMRFKIKVINLILFWTRVILSINKGKFDMFHTTVFDSIEKWSVIAEYDVVVSGAGPGGIAAAIAAARNGAKVGIIEQQGYAGGVSVGSLVPNIMGFEMDGKIIVDGIAGEFARKMGEKSGAYLNGQDVFPINKDTLINQSVLCKPHSISVTASKMLCETNVDKHFYTRVIGTVVDNGEIKAIAVDRVEGVALIIGKIFIDATADARLAYDSGARILEASAEEAMTKTLIFDVGGVVGFSREEAAEDFDKAFKAGKVPVKIQDYFMGYSLMEEGQVQLNFTAVTGNALKSRELTRMDEELRQQIDDGIKFFRENITGFSKCYLLRTPNTIGVRAGRAGLGLECITKKDIDENTPVEEPIAIGIRRYGDHGIKSFGGAPITGNRPIPWKALISADIRNLAFAGRSISCEPSVITCIRYMAQCMATGQAAGTGAALAVQNGITLKNVDYSQLKAILISAGAIIE